MGYKESFSLNVNDIDLIESAIRDQIRALLNQMPMVGQPATPEAKHAEWRINELRLLLGKLHNQKIFYGQVRHTKDPVSG